MKRRMMGICLAAMLITQGCGANAAQSAQTETPPADSTVAGTESTAAEAGDSDAAVSDRIRFADYKLYFGSEEPIEDFELTLAFVDGVEDLPYIEVDEWADFMGVFASGLIGDDNYNIEVKCEGDFVTFTRDTDYTLVCDFENDTLDFMDYDSFLISSKQPTLLDIVSSPEVDENGEVDLLERDVEASFDRQGGEKVIDLAAYGIDLVRDGDIYLLPLQTVGDLMVSPLLNCGVAFNGEAVFLGTGDSMYDINEDKLTPFGEIYMSAPKKEKSEELAEYSYNELCLVFDTMYGLKDQHNYQSVRDVFEQTGLDDDLKSTDAAVSDEALAIFLNQHIDDLHSGFSLHSYLTDEPVEKNMTYGTANLKIEEHMDLYRDTREAFYPDGIPAYEEVGNTAYVTFDHFDMSADQIDFYNEENIEDHISSNTVALIIYAHSQITREGSPIENVVFDMSNNIGGEVDAGMFAVSWFLGNAPLSIKNSFSGAMSTTVYRADVNLDRKFDETDTVADKNLYCLISPVSFSMGNSLPASLDSSKKVTMLGRTTGGGACSVLPICTAYGTFFQISSMYEVSFLKNGSFYDVDRGVEPDYYIDMIADYYDRAALTEYINGLF